MEQNFEVYDEKRKQQKRTTRIQKEKQNTKIEKTEKREKLKNLIIKRKKVKRPSIISKKIPHE